METYNLFAKMLVLAAVIVAVNVYTEGLLRLHARQLLNFPVIALVATGGAVGGYFLHGPLVAAATGFITLSLLQIMSTLYHRTSQDVVFVKAEALKAERLQLEYVRPMQFPKAVAKSPIKNPDSKSKPKSKAKS